MLSKLNTALTRLRASVHSYAEAALLGEPSNGLVVQLFRANCGISDIPVRSMDGSIAHLCDLVDRFRSTPVSERTHKLITAQAQLIYEQVDRMLAEGMHLADEDPALG